MTTEKITCLMVTRKDRWPLLKKAVFDFQAQTGVDANLLIVHDDGDDFQNNLKSHLSDALNVGKIQILQAPSGLTLGELRNIAVERAQGEWVCQWDDDDRNHPKRLRLQYESMRAHGADASFLQDQMHCFVAERKLYWTEWYVDAFPLDVVPGTLMARRKSMPAYPATRRAEDSDLCHTLYAQGVNTHRIRGLGWAYIYQYHGSNTWELNHHQEIIAVKSLNVVRMADKSSQLQLRLNEYAAPIFDNTSTWRQEGTSLIAN